MRYLFFVMFSTAISINAHASALENLRCTEAQAKQNAASHPPIAEFCAGKVNGQSHGCAFMARTPSPLNREEQNNPELSWVVEAAIIHSFDEKGQPRFMPEGFMFVNVSKSCKILDTTQAGSVPVAD